MLILASYCLISDSVRNQVNKLMQSVGQYGQAAVDTSNATGKLILNVMSSVSQFEREMMLERQREGIAKAKAEGKYKGRKPTARAKTEMVKLALEKGVSKAQICRDLGISKTSLYRIIADMQF